MSLLPHCEYRSVAERRYHASIGEYRTYGIQVASAGFTLIVHDVSVYENEAACLAALFNLHQLSPVHLLDAVQDLLS